jgi:hypothetical protein
MAYQIVELEMDKDDVVQTRKVVPYPYATRQEAVDTIESLISKHAKGGYEPASDCWWAEDARGDRYRFVIEVV